MVETLPRARPPAMRTMVLSYGSSSTRLGVQVRALAEDMAGRIDRDELSSRDEALVLEAVEEAVAAAMPEVLALLDRELTPRLESLPSSTRLTLARARRRREFGID
jgi:hypothetical protein